MSTRPFVIKDTSGRLMKYATANLYFSNKMYGHFSLTQTSVTIAGRPFRIFTYPIIEEQPDSFWWACVYVSACGRVLAQYLGDSGELALCASALGIPFDVVGVIELLICAQV